MTILFLCREDNAVREIAGYAQAFRRCGITLCFVPTGTPLNVELYTLCAILAYGVFSRVLVHNLKIFLRAH